MSVAIAKKMHSVNCTHDGLEIARWICKFIDGIQKNWLDKEPWGTPIIIVVTLRDLSYKSLVIICNKLNVLKEALGYQWEMISTTLIEYYTRTAFLEILLNRIRCTTLEQLTGVTHFFWSNTYELDQNLSVTLMTQ